MPKMSIDFTKFEQLLTEYSQIREVSLPDAVALHARLVCVELGRRTQPFGFGADAQALGEARVQKDIQQIIKMPAWLLGVAQRLRNQRLSQRLRLLTQNAAWSSVQALLKNARFGEFEYLGTSVAQTHNAHRHQRTGRTFKRASKLFVTESSTLHSYIEQEKNRVGLSKAGWAAAAKSIRQVISGSQTRGFANWVLRNNGSGSAIDMTRSNTNPSAAMTNGTPWADRVIPLAEQISALNNVAARMKRQMAEILKYRRRQAAYTE